MEKIKLKWEVIALVVILLIALGLRLYRIDGYLTFLGDEGRDVRIVRDLLAGNLVFIGPMTSIGNMYLGPLYYYLIAPALFLSSGSPVGPAVMIALLMTATVGLTWSLAHSWFGRFPALIAALLFCPLARRHYLFPLILEPQPDALFCPHLNLGYLRSLAEKEICLPFSGRSCPRRRSSDALPGLTARPHPWSFLATRS